MPDSASPPLELDQVLCDEALQIHGRPIKPGTPRSAIYATFNELQSAALCLSGGGIRSAAFCLGAIQAMGGTPVAGVPQPDAMTNSLLGRFHYLSTVSGGGYIGSWLSLWIRRDPDGFLSRLIGRPAGPDDEPRELAWLRANSNYLTPKLGATSADAWANAALCIRNLVLNWLVMVPVLLLALLAVKWLLVATALAAAKPAGDTSVFWLSISAAVVLLAVSGGLALRNSPSGGSSSLTQPVFIGFVLAPAVAAAFLASLAFGTKASLDVVGSWDRPRTLFVGAAVAAVVYGVAWLLAANVRSGFRDLFCWLCAGAVHGVMVGFGIFALNHTDSFQGLMLGVAVPSAKIVTLFVYGVPMLLTAHLTAEMIFVGLTAYQPNSDEDREWFGRSAGWFTAVAVGWLVAGLLSVLVATLIHDRHTAGITLTTVFSGAVTAWLGSSSWSPALEKVKGIKSLTPNLILAVAVPIFAAALIVAGSVILDTLLLHHSLLQSPLLGGKPEPTPARHQELFWLCVGVVSTIGVGSVASLSVNVNRFSLHALYRNRLIRAFLGATNQDRHPNPFTQFDNGDNPLMADLWTGRAGWKPFHVVNIALNIVSTQRLAWQERKAESFTVSPLHAGSACKAYRPSASYGGAAGITLGTAMAISGAAVSPNMGYHSSAPISFLMALLNVRLGWWLGNPGPEGETTYRLEGPAVAVAPLLMEAFGLTTDRRKYVYLSDGGHFENLGLYEMVRRRCRFIVVIDAGCDHAYAFEDLGNAVRKIWLDLGIAIDIPHLDTLKPRPVDGGTVGPGHPYHVTGTIDYASADGHGAPGRLLYVKPGFHGVESAGIRSYATANLDFPHQSTLDQWFSESQFESYRGLGFEIMRDVIKKARRADPAKPLELAQLFEGLDAGAHGPTLRAAVLTA